MSEEEVIVETTGDENATINIDGDTVEVEEYEGENPDTMISQEEIDEGIA